MTRKIYRETTTTTVREIIEDTPDQPSSFFAGLIGNQPPAPKAIAESVRGTPSGEVAIRGWCQYTRLPIIFVGKRQPDQSLLLEKFHLIQSAAKSGGTGTGYSTTQNFDGRIGVAPHVYCGACFKSDSFLRCSCNGGTFVCHISHNEKLYCPSCEHSSISKENATHFRATLHADDSTRGAQAQIANQWSAKPAALLAPRASVPEVGYGNTGQGAFPSPRGSAPKVGYTAPRRIGHSGSGQRALPAPKSCPLLLGHDGNTSGDNSWDEPSGWDDGGSDDSF
jgi:hypothetical protein